MSLYRKICARESLFSAWKKVRKKNAKGGIDGISPGDLDRTISVTIDRLNEELKNNTYVPAPYERIRIPKFNESNEWRPLSLPVVEDKIIQQSVVDHLTPVFNPIFLNCSYAYRRKKGAGKAIRRLEHILKTRKSQWVVLYDIDNFFDNINHDILSKALAEKIEESELLSLIRLWLNAGYITSKGQFFDPVDGIAQGSIISPLCSNIYLHRLDQFADDEAMDYIRYSDNLIILCPDKDTAEVCQKKVLAFVNQELVLKMNDSKRPPVNINTGFVFLGIYFKGSKRAISQGKEKKTLKKLAYITRVSSGFPIETVVRKINDQISHHKRYYGPINPEKQFAAFDGFIGERMKYLLKLRYQKEQIKSKKEIEKILLDLDMYCPHDDKTRKKIAGKIADDIVSPMGRHKKDPRPRKTNTKMNTFLKERSSFAEVVIKTPGTFIGKTGKRLVIKQQRKNIFERQLSKIKQVTVLSTGVSLSSDLIHSCTKNNISMSFLKYTGKPYAVVTGPDYPSSLLSLSQLKIYESERALKLAARMLNGKSRNQMNLIKFYSRHRSKNDTVFKRNVTGVLDAMKHNLEGLSGLDTGNPFDQARNQLFLTEARISGYYWDMIKKLLPADLRFEKRNKQGASDVVNNMLNYGYGILYQRVWSAAINAGLHPGISFLHALQENKPTLIFDMVEEFRQPLVDRPLFSMMTKGNRYQKFRLNRKTGLLDSRTREMTLNSVLNRLSSLVGFRGRKVKAEDIIAIQAGSLAKYILGKIKTYKPFISTY